MNGQQFHNALRIMLNLDADDLRRSEVIDSNWGTPEASDRDQLSAFLDDPFREAIRMPDANFDRLWKLIEASN